MRLHLQVVAVVAALANPSVVAAADAASSSTSSNRPGPQLYHDLRQSLSALFSAPLRRRHSSHPRRAVLDEKARWGTNMNSPNQCVLKPAKHTVPPLGGGLTNTTSPASASGASSTSKAGGRATATPTTSTSTGKGAPTTTTTTTPAPAPTSPWKKKMDSSGSDFFDDWTFWSAEDPTHGTVTYITGDEAFSTKLAEVDSDGQAIMRVDTVPVSTGWRRSVRIHSKIVFNGGLWILDATHMPIGCGTWPAFWTHGPDWPVNGEIDILEGVNDNQFNQAALHTRDGCTISNDFGGSGVPVGYDCTAHSTGNTGCGIRSTDDGSYGASFNSGGGGVYAMLWDDQAISIWFFKRGSIPKDLIAEEPMPANWGRPSARWGAPTCPPNDYNKDHHTIFDTTLCGDWAGSAWNTPPNGGGDSCAVKTGVATCAEYVQNNGGAFSEAYWKVKSVKIYQTTP